jgi:hypothetical protein
VRGKKNSISVYHTGPYLARAFFLRAPGIAAGSSRNQAVPAQAVAI